MARDKTFKLATNEEFLKTLDEVLPGCGAPLPVIKTFGIYQCLECRQRANGLRLPAHMKRMKAGVRRTKVTCGCSREGA